MNQCGLDYSKTLIIKAALGDDIRKIPIQNDDITYDELILMMQRVFKSQLTAVDEVTVKYRDEDGDLITLLDNSDLAFAIQCNRVLRLKLFVKNKISKLGFHDADMIFVMEKLTQIRNAVDALLDGISENSKASGCHGESRRSCETTDLDYSVKTDAVIKQSQEFDPLRQVDLGGVHHRGGGYGNNYDHGETDDVSGHIPADRTVGGGRESVRSATPASIGSSTGQTNYPAGAVPTSCPVGTHDNVATIQPSVQQVVSPLQAPVAAAGLVRQPNDSARLNGLVPQPAGIGQYAPPLGMQYAAGGGDRQAVYGAMPSGSPFAPVGPPTDGHQRTVETKAVIGGVPTPPPQAVVGQQAQMYQPQQQLPAAVTQQPPPMTNQYGVSYLSSAPPTSWVSSAAAPSPAGFPMPPASGSAYMPGVNPFARTGVAMQSYVKAPFAGGQQQQQPPPQ